MQMVITGHWLSYNAGFCTENDYKVQERKRAEAFAPARHDGLYTRQGPTGSWYPVA